MSKTAMIAGASGIVGGAPAEHLVADGWTVHGLAMLLTAHAGVIP